MPRKLAEIRRLMHISEENRVLGGYTPPLKRIFFHSQNHANTFAQQYPDAIEAGCTPTKIFQAYDKKNQLCPQTEYTHTALVPANTKINDLKATYNISDAKMLWSGPVENVVYFGQPQTPSNG